jgi:hypothetical protein
VARKKEVEKISGPLFSSAGGRIDFGAGTKISGKGLQLRG